MSHESIAILDQLISEKLSRENRSTSLLKDPYTETKQGWYMFVPSCFNDALDIKQTYRIVNKKQTLLWTQGSSFNFKIGDSIYNTAVAYDDWEKAVHNVSLCVQVKVGTSAGPTEDGTRRYSGSVTFEFLMPNRERSKIVGHGEHTMSQDDFVRFLIEGPAAELDEKLRSSIITI